LFTVAPLKGVRLSFGRVAIPDPLELMVTGVSSIHSAVARLEGYGVVVVNFSWRVRSWSVIRHLVPPEEVSATDAWIRSPGLIFMWRIVVAGSGTSSHQAE
jgi:hypothetical protein